VNAAVLLIFAEEKSGYQKSAENKKEIDTRPSKPHPEWVPGDVVPKYENDGERPQRVQLFEPHP
jgi:hypothetical protein